MQLSVTFRHMDASDALKEYAAEKVDRIRKYFHDPIKAHIVLSCERSYEHQADVMITLPNGILAKGSETTEDMYSSIDLVMAKIERQCRRYKEKIRHHKGLESLHGQREIVHTVMALQEAAPKDVTDASDQIKIIKSSRFVARPMSAKEAVMQMNLLGNDFLVFTNATSHEVNVVYRRGDGEFGLIEVGQGSGAAGARMHA